MALRPTLHVPPSISACKLSRDTEESWDCSCACVSGGTQPAYCSTCSVLRHPLASLLLSGGTSPLFHMLAPLVVSSCSIMERQQHLGTTGNALQGYVYAMRTRMNTCTHMRKCAGTLNARMHAHNTHTHTYIYIYVYTCMIYYMYVYYTYTRISNTCIRMHLHSCGCSKHICILCACTLMQMYMCAHRNMCAYMCLHVHVHTKNICT